MLSPSTWLSGRRLLAALLGAQIASPVLGNIQLNVNDKSSVEDAASYHTWAAMGWYGGNETGNEPGAFPEKWWEGAALFHAALQYWFTSGDTVYNSQMKEGMQKQAGSNGDYMPSKYASYLGNDDQAFWGLLSMSAAEWKFEDVPDGYSWLSLAQGVFNTQAARWDTTTCGGGLRWQLFPYQPGYAIKNSISNGAFFQIAARLARYTHNATYAEWAEKVWDWSVESPLVNNKTWNIGDTTEIKNDCATLGNNQWSYNYGTYLAGAAYMQTYTNGTVQKWKDVVDGILGVTLNKFFPEKHGGDTMSEILCEPRMLCNNNEILFKGYVSSWLALTGLLLPDKRDRIDRKLKGSAKSLSESCDGMGNNTCGVRWWGQKWDGWSGMEEEISAACGFSAPLLLGKGDVPVTSFTGGNSTSNPNAGSEGTSHSGVQLEPITTGDKAGAGILTALFVGGWVALIVWMVLGG